MRLTEKHKRFADEYLTDLNATAAYGRAGYKAKGDAAKVNASRLLTKANVQEYIQDRMKKREQRTEITQDMVLQELAKIGFSDMRTFTTWNNRGVALVDSEQLTQDQSACVSEVSQTITESGGSLEKIGRHLGMFNDNLTLKGGLTITKKLEDLL